MNDKVCDLPFIRSKTTVLDWQTYHHQTHMEAAADPVLEEKQKLEYPPHCQGFTNNLGSKGKRCHHHQTLMDNMKKYV